MKEELPDHPYFVFLSRSENRPLTEVWPVALDQPLPVIPIPLLGDDPDVPLDLQAAFEQVYDVLGYDLAIDYRQEPEVPLAEDAASWADRLLRELGKRP